MGSKNINKVIKVLIVDDSAFMRKAIGMMLESDPNIKVIGTARDGEEGVEKVKTLNPDLVTMDIEMPRMDGLTALREIMNSNPVPVIMLSSLTTDGASATLDAFELGAVDFIPKQLSFVSLDIVKIKEDLLKKIKDIARRKNILMAQYRRKKFNQIKFGVGTKDTKISHISSGTTLRRGISRRNHPIRMIAIGSSTGGPPALQAVITKLPRNLPVGILIAQHMPPQFTKSMADRLDSLSQVRVIEAKGGEKISAGTVYIAPGGKHLTIRKSGSCVYTVVSEKPVDSAYKPSVDLLMNSIAKIYGKVGMGVILTGMGSDGVNGIRNLKSKGGIIIAQNEESCVVYGMPKAVIEAKVTNHITSIDNIAHEIISYF